MIENQPSHNVAKSVLIRKLAVPIGVFEDYVTVYIKMKYDGIENRKEQEDCSRCIQWRNVLLYQLFCQCSYKNHQVKKCFFKQTTRNLFTLRNRLANNRMGDHAHKYTNHYANNNHENGNNDRIVLELLLRIRTQILHFTNNLEKYLDKQHHSIRKLRNLLIGIVLVSI